MIFNLVWTKEDTFKIFGLVLFVSAFYVVYQQLQQAERRLQANETKRGAKIEWNEEGSVKQDWYIYIYIYIYIYPKAPSSLPFSNTNIQMTHHITQQQHHLSRRPPQLPSPNHMQMQMIHTLRSMLPIINHHPKPLRTLLFPHTLRHK